MAGTRRSTTARSLHSVRFPGETPAYRAARNRLLRAERDLRRRLEAVATLRRALPLGGVVREDYVFEEGGPSPDDLTTVRRVRMSELFADGKPSLLVYSYMFGPAMPDACPMCTSLLDGLDGTVAHATERVNFVVVAKSPIQRVRAFARDRGWRRLRLLSSAGNTYNRDYLGEDATGAQNPSLNVFVRLEGAIHHFYNTELFFLGTGRGQHPRHVDLLWPLWNLFDLTPEGRGTDWYPQLRYDTAR